MLERSNKKNRYQERFGGVQRLIISVYALKGQSVKDEISIRNPTFELYNENFLAVSGINPDSALEMYIEIKLNRYDHIILRTVEK